MSENKSLRARLAARVLSVIGCVVGFFRSRAACSAVHAAGLRALQSASQVLTEAAESVAEAERREAEVTARVNELRLEVNQLSNEKAALAAQLALRELEVTELTLYLQRNRERAKADIALEVARQGAPGAARG